MELIAAFCAGVVVTIVAQLVSPKVTDVIGNWHRSRAVSKAKALIAQEAAAAAALAQAKALVASSATPPPAPPANPLAPKA